MTILYQPFAVSDLISVVRETPTPALQARLAARDACDMARDTDKHVIRMAAQSAHKRVSTHGRLTTDGLVYIDRSCRTRGNIIKRACRGRRRRHSSRPQR